MATCNNGRCETPGWAAFNKYRLYSLVGAPAVGLVVAAHHGGVPERDVVHVEQDFVFALAAPDLAAGVAGVGQDRADGALGPGQAAAVPVTGPVMG